MMCVISPFMFALNSDASEDEFNAFVDNILAFDEWGSSHREDIYTLSTAGELLAEQDCYPYFEKLRPLLETYDCDVDFKDVCKVLERYLEKAHHIDELCERECIEKKTECLESRMQADCKRWSESERQTCLDLWWYVFALHLIDKVDMDAFVVFARGMDELIRMKYSYECIDSQINANETILKTETVDIQCFSSFFAFIQHAKTAFLMWQQAQSKEDLYWGLYLYVMREKGIKDLSMLRKECEFSIQDSFYDDFCRNHYASRPSDINSALESMAKVILNIRHGETHNMRTGAGSNDPYLYHGDYAGMRKNVNRSIKLHYWKRPKCYRFAKIGEHDFFGFPWED